MGALGKWLAMHGAGAKEALGGVARGAGRLGRGAVEMAKEHPYGAAGAAAGLGGGAALAEHEMEEETPSDKIHHLLAKLGLG